MLRAEFFDLSTNFLCIVDAQGICLEVNQAFAAVVDCTPDECVGRPFMDMFTASDVYVNVFKEALQTLSSASPSHFEATIQGKDGRQTLASWTLSKHASGSILVVGEDGTLTEALGKALQGSIEKSTSLLEAISDGCLMIDHENRVMDINAEAERILQRSYASLIGKSLVMEVPRLLTTECFATYAAAVQVPTAFNCTEYFPFLHLWLYVRGYPTDDGFAIYLQDITARVEAEEKLRQSEERYRGIVDSQIDLVCRYLPDTTLTFVNDAYCQFFGKTREELLGASFLPHTTELHHLRIHTRIADLIAGSKPGVSEVPTINVNGEVRWIEWVDYGIKDEHGNVIAIQAVGRDITRGKQLEEERLYTQSLEAELSKERELREYKDRFISLVSHEFRTPLAIIRTSTEILTRYTDKFSPEKIREKLSSVEEQVTRMFTLMDGVLLVSKGSAKKLVFQPEAIQMHEFLERLIENMRLSDQDKHPFVLEASDIDGEFQMDRRLLEHVLINLLTNAAKYSDAGRPVILAAERANKCLTFKISDQGIGIPETDRELLFEPFHRAGNVGSIEGTGLGLSIVKQSVEAHGGNIRFETEMGKGTTFIVTIPLP
jgi:PAS domain S-box-containing protein